MTDTTKDKWLTLAYEAYHQSTTYIDSNYRKQWDNNIRAFNSRHHLGSKYFSDLYTYRSKLFRPKTRASLRKNEAAAATAFFGNMDVLDVTPANPKDPNQCAAADVMKELIQYRLTHSIPWFKICIGALQDAMVQGAVASYQSWIYKEVMDEENPRTTIDKPWVELIPLENLRIHPAASWINPIETSPYVIRLIPMFLLDIKARMEKDDPKTGMPRWKEYTDDEIRSAVRNEYDSTRMAREGDREDKYSLKGAPGEEGETKALGLFDTAWVHENFIKVDDEVWHYYTLGTQYLLSEPERLRDVYLHGQIPIVLGQCTIHTHRAVPASLVEMGEPLQRALNDNVNQRSDNVKLVLNKRWLVKRGCQVDIKSLVRNVAGGVTMVTNTGPQGDVEKVEFADVTASSYQEQNLLNLDYDDLVGTFQGSTIQANRKLNETVGGMRMLETNMGALTEYTLKTFGETWAEPVLNQIAHLEQAYETDELVMNLVGDKSQVYEKYGASDINSLLAENYTLTVNVGISSTDPGLKMAMFRTGLAAINEVAGTPAAQFFDIEEIAKEVWGRLGYKDGARFLNKQLLQAGAQQQDPEKMQMAQALQELTAQVQQMQQQLSDKQGEMQLKQADLQSKYANAEAERQHKLTLEQLRQDAENKRKAADVAIQRLETDTRIKNEWLHNERQRQHEHLQNAASRYHEAEEAKADREHETHLHEQTMKHQEHAWKKQKGSPSTKKPS